MRNSITNRVSAEIPAILKNADKKGGLRPKELFEELLKKFPDELEGRISIVSSIIFRMEKRPLKNVLSERVEGSRVLSYIEENDREYRIRAENLKGTLDFACLQNKLSDMLEEFETSGFFNLNILKMSEEEVLKYYKVAHIIADLKNTLDN